MKEFRRKQKKFYKIMKTLIIFSVIFIFIFIGAQPYVAEFSAVADVICRYFCDALIIANLCVLFSYFNRYSKSDKFLEAVEYELSDYGSYITVREEKEEKAFIKAMQNDFSKSRYAVNSDVEIDEFDFSFVASAKKDFFYTAEIKSLSRDDILAYIDVVVNDITVHNLRRKGNAVICFVTDKPEDEAVSLSKMITPLGKKEQIKIAIAIVEAKTGKCYFLGNAKTKCQQLIANYVLKCGVMIPKENIGDKRLPFQDALEKHMEDFDIKSFKNGTFYAH